MRVDVCGGPLYEGGGPLYEGGCMWRTFIIMRVEVCGGPLYEGGDMCGGSGVYKRRG